MELISSAANPLIKKARALRQHKVRAETGLFLVEGIHHVGEVMEAGWKVETVLYAPDLLTSSYAGELIERTVRLPARLQPVSAKVMGALAGKDNPQGILAIVHQRQASLDALRGAQRIVALVAPQDPGNVGAILRSVDAAGADGLALLDGGVDLFHPTVVRASMGALFWKPVVRSSFDEFAEHARTNGWQLIATSAHSVSDPRAFAPRLPWALVLGSEQKGLSEQQTSACDATIGLPMRGRVSSLNLAVAAGVLLYHLQP